MEFFSDQLASNLAASAKSPARPSAEACLASAFAGAVCADSHLVMTTDRREAREIVREPRFCWRSEIC